MVSTFSGGGGTCLGFLMAGFTILRASEFNPEARASYAHNLPGTPIDPRDIREVKPEEILQAIGKKRGELDVFEGSPPCISFSPAGKRSKHWGEVKPYAHTKQRSDDLFLDFLRIAEGLQAKIIVAENVYGMLIGNAKGYVLEVVERMESAGYRVKAQVLDAQWLGVPQMRKRIIFVGTRKDLGLDPGLAFPAPLPYRYTLRDSIGDLQGPLPADSVIKPEYMAVQSGANLEGTRTGREWAKTEQGSSSKKYFMLKRSHFDLPCKTVTAVGGVTHPTECRKFTIAELRRICSFPDDYEPVGSFGQQWERLGLSVPPLMARAVAVGVARLLLPGPGVD